MTSDPLRQQYIWVNDFTEEEANNYLNKVGFTSNEEIRKMVFENYGTRPSYLRDISNSEQTLKPDEFIEEQIKKNEQKVKRCVKDDETTVKLFKEMVKDEYKVGMKEGIVMDIMKLSTGKVAEGPLVKIHHILAFDIEKGIFKFHSNSMREATRRFIERNK